MSNPGKGGPDHVNFLTLMKKMQQPAIRSDEPRVYHSTYGRGPEIAGQDGLRLRFTRMRG